MTAQRPPQKATRRDTQPHEKHPKETKCCKLPGLLNRATTVVPHVPYCLLNIDNGSSGQCTSIMLLRDIIRWMIHTPSLLLGGAAAAAGQLRGSCLTW